jgi:hypothetical protein
LASGRRRRGLLPQTGCLQVGQIIDFLPLSKSCKSEAVASMLSSGAAFNVRVKVPYYHIASIMQRIRN